jgi:hypothetical protein
MADSGRTLRGERLSPAGVRAKGLIPTLNDLTFAEDSENTVILEYRKYSRVFVKMCASSKMLGGSDRLRESKQVE